MAQKIRCGWKSMESILFMASAVSRFRRLGSSAVSIRWTFAVSFSPTSLPSIFLYTPSDSNLSTKVSGSVAHLYAPLHPAVICCVGGRNRCGGGGRCCTWLERRPGTRQDVLTDVLLYLSSHCVRPKLPVLFDRLSGLHSSVVNCAFRWKLEPF